MKSTGRSRCRIIGLAAYLALASSAWGEQDHLLGYKAQDLNQLAAPATVNTSSGLVGPQGCELKKAQFIMFPTEKNGGDDPRGGTSAPFVCYKAKCPFLLPPFAADTQFGAVNMASKKAKILCLPADVDFCGDGDIDGSEQCDGTDDDACPGLCQPDCSCGTPPPCTGAEVGGFCWFFGGNAQSCDTVCGNQGLAYDNATATYAGSGGTDANCQAVIAALGLTGGWGGSGDCGAQGLGCYGNSGVGLLARCATPATTAAASLASGQRVCACQ